LLVYSDSLNSVEMFHSLCTHKGYNKLFLFFTGLLIDNRISLHVCHVVGVNNPVADTLSRALFNLTCQLVPGINIGYFTPLQCALGELKK
ncbi:hypothetical protein M422DRAFT_155327, partial [Sphaerobolus stellatus SS14]